MSCRNKTISYSLVSLTLWAILLALSLDSCKQFPEDFLHITTDPVEVLVDRTYKLSGSIKSIGEENITQHGFCWSTTTNPSISSDTTQLGATDSKGIFSSVITDLPLSTMYYVRSYVHTQSGTEYGKEKSFTTPAPGLPTVTTNVVSSISQYSAQSGGILTDDGGSDIIAWGICWDTNTLPTIDKNRTSTKIETSSFTSSFTGLSCSSTYFVRAYATNEAGTAYGNQVSFTTSACSPELPNVITTAIENVSENAALVGGNVTDDGFSSVTARGVCWSVTSYPTITDSHTSDGIGIGTYTSSLTALTPNTKYYVRAYATNAVGTGYGEEESLLTHSSTDETVSDYDGNVYQTVQIGNQVWMKENLRVTHYSDGTEIPLIEDESAWGSLTTSEKAYSWYDNSSTNRELYGGLYTWPAAMNGAGSSDTNPSSVQGVCPSDWHLPSDEEWKEMEMALGMSQEDADLEDSRGTDEGGRLKEAGTEHWDSPNSGATNETGFTGLPAGSRDLTGVFRQRGGSTGYWSTSMKTSSLIWSRDLGFTYTTIIRSKHSIAGGFSVRCVRDF